MCIAKIHKSFFTFLLPFLTCLCLVTTAQAQEPTAVPTMIRVNQIQLNPTLTERFRAFHIFQVLPGQRSGGVPWRLTTEVVFGNSWEMSVIIPLENFAELDDNQVVNTELRDALFATAVDSRRSFVVQSRPDLSIPGRDGILPVSRVVQIQVKDGQIAAFEEFWKNAVIPAMTQSGIREYSVFQTVIGGPQGEYYGTIYFDTFAELDGFSIIGGLNATQQAEFQRSFGELAQVVDITLSLIDGELSYGLPNLQP